MRETLEALEKVLKKEIKAVTDKGTMTPSELDTIMKAMCCYDMAEERIMKESGYEGFSKDGYSQRYYRDNMGGGNSNYMPDMMPVSYNYDGNSYARGRSPITGRYVSRDYNNGHSGHSIKDRMIDSLERMMDQAGSEYERQEIARQIEKMRSGE